MDRFDIQVIHPLLNIQTILQVQISLEINQHSTASLHLVLSDDSVVKRFNALNQSPIGVKQGDTPLFYGIIRNAEVRQEAQFTHIIIQSISGTWLMDQDCKQRSFQHTAMTYADLVNKVCSTYSGYHAMMESDTNETIGIPLIQYEETDWAFLQRVASRQNAVLVPDVYVSSPSFHFGFPQQNNEAVILEKSQYTTGISTKWATQSQNRKLDYLYYKIEDKVNYPIGKQIRLNGRTLWIIGKEIRVEQGACIYYYTLGGSAFFYEEIRYNQHITGLSILGTVLESAGETVKLHLDIDNEQDAGTAYPYCWTPPTGNLMYCVPEVGTRVSLYFGGQDESCAKAVNCVRTNASSCEGFSDPAKRSLSTVQGGAFDLYPTVTSLHNTSNLLSLDDDGGIIVSSKLPISMVAPEVSIKAETQLSISSKSQMVLAKMDSAMATPLAALSIFNQIDTLSQQFTQVSGRFKETFDPIDDEPKEGKLGKEFWGKLALNVLGGLAVVALACTGIGLVFGSGLVLGAAIGGGIAVGACVVGDIASGNVSGIGEYIYSGISGVAMGAIFSGVTASQAFTEARILERVGRISLTGFATGTMDSVGRQYIRNQEINIKQAVIDGCFIGVLSGGMYFLSQLKPIFDELDNKIIKYFNDKKQATYNRVNGNYNANYDFWENKVPRNGEDWCRFFRETYGSNNVIWENAKPSQLARSWQGAGKYPGIDDYVDVTIKKGMVLYRGEPNGTEYFTTLKAIEKSGRNANIVFEGLQVEKHPIYGYRGIMQGYVFNEDIASAYGITKANMCILCWYIVIDNRISSFG